MRKSRCSRAGSERSVERRDAICIRAWARVRLAPPRGGIMMESASRTVESRLGHRFGIQDLVQVAFADLRMAQARDLSNRLAGLEGFLGDLGRLVVADDRRQRGADSQALLHHSRAVFG